MNTKDFKYYAEFSLYEIVLLISLLSSGIIDGYLENFFEYISSKLNYKRENIIITALELSLQFLIIIFYFYYIQKLIKLLIKQQPFFSTKGEYRFDPRSKNIASISHAFVLFFSQMHLKRKITFVTKTLELWYNSTVGKTIPFLSLKRGVDSP